MSACRACYHAAPLLPFLCPFSSLAHLPAMPATAMINSNFVLTALRFRVCNALALCTMCVFIYFLNLRRRNRGFFNQCTDLKGLDERLIEDEKRSEESSPFTACRYTSIEKNVGVLSTFILWLRSERCHLPVMKRTNDETNERSNERAAKIKRLCL